MNCVLAFQRAREALPAFALVLGLAACANPQATGGAAPASAAGSPNLNCKDMQRQLEEMKQRGQGESPAYRKMLDRYLGRCFG